VVLIYTTKLQLIGLTATKTIADVQHPTSIAVRGATARSIHPRHAPPLANVAICKSISRLLYLLHYQLLSKHQMTTKRDEKLTKSTEDLREKLRRNEQLINKRKRASSAAAKEKLRKENFSKMLVAGRMALSQTDEDTMRALLSAYLTDEDERALFCLPPVTKNSLKCEQPLAPVVDTQQNSNEALTDKVENVLVELPLLVNIESAMEQSSAPVGIEPESQNELLSSDAVAVAPAAIMQTLNEVELPKIGSEVIGSSQERRGNSVARYYSVEPDHDLDYLLD
jgi:hypothetical protein